MTNELSLINIIKKHIESGEMVLPVFSASAMRIQKELVKDEVDIRVVENIISGDQSLSSQVLKLANSSFYKGLVEIQTIKAAIIRLGLQEISKITLLASTRNQFRSDDKALNVIMKKLWQHSVGCALGSHWLAKRCKLDDVAGHAFFAGLLHDTGKLFILLVIDEMNKEDKRVPFSEPLVLEAMESLHTEQGYNLMRGWNMPTEYCVVARDHHNEEFDTKNITMLLVRMANIVCRKLGIGTEQNEDIVPSAAFEAELLNLSELDIAELEIMLEDTPSLSA